MTETIMLAGTRKGLVVARSNDDRRTWEMDPIRFSTHSVYAVGFDTRRSTPRLFAAAASGHFGSILTHSDDLGKTWIEPEQTPISFPEGSDASLERVWQIAQGPASAPDVVYAGVEPHALFRSEDGGITFSLVEGLYDHPHRKEWQPGNGGACLHTVLPHPEDPDQILVALSAGGVYRTRDGGESWEPANAGIQAYWLPEDRRFPEFGQCVHKVAGHPSRPERLFAQNHFGVYRSEDWGTSWKPIEDGLPATFGFPVVVHPQHPDTLFIVPLSADMNRMPADGPLRVYRSEDAGASWEAFGKGLPDRPYYSAVLRDAMCTDDGDPAAIYVGSRSGDVFVSSDAGESWDTVATHLPDVFSLRAVVVS